MAKRSQDVYNAVGKSNVLFFDPATLHLVTDDKSPLYDERVHNAPQERMVRSIMVKGVRVPIIIVKNPETGATEVVDGRQRVINAREANRRLVAQGDEPVQVPGVVQKYVGNGADLADVMVLTNELRDSDTPTNRARKMQRLADFGRDEEAIGLVFGCSAQTVRATLGVLDLSADARKALDAGQVTMSQAKQLAKLTPDEQRAKVAELIQAGAGAKPREKAAKQRAVMGDAKPQVRSLRELRKLRDEFDPNTFGRSLLDWVLCLEDVRPVAKAAA